MMKCSGFEIIRQVLNPWSARAIAIRAGYCDICARMLGTPQGIKALCTLPGYRHHNYQECRESAQRGCQLCGIIFHQGWEAEKKLNLGSASMHELQGAPVYFVSRKPKTTGMGRYDGNALKGWAGSISKGFGDIAWLEGGFVEILEIPKPSPKERNPQPRVTWYGLMTIAALASYDNPAGQYFPERTVCDSFLDDGVMEEARRWIADCVEGRHETCVYLGEPRLPTRILDVGAVHSSAVSLRATGANDYGQYAALSYCWGGPQPLMATKSNIAQLMAGIEVSALPQTLRDAVLTTRRLGIPYLWIDALCIIQDSVEDKMNEIEKMGLIYRNATVTLAASYARKASDGFLKASMEDRSTWSCTVPVCLPQQSRVGQVKLEVNTGSPNRNPEPLRTRGWAFQEAILSQRLLVFSKYELRCHCRVAHRRSLNFGSFTQSTDPVLFSPGGRVFEELDSHHKNEGDGWMSAPFLNNLWDSMLRDFTLRSVSVPDDRLCAVQGVANELLRSRHLSDDLDKTYFAGTWAACLPEQLLWCRSNIPLLSPDGMDPSKTPPSLKRSSRAPSWSWASLDCPIVFAAIEYERSAGSFSISDKSSQPQGLDFECNILRRSLDEFSRDRSTASDIRINMDLDADELGPEAKTVHYLLFSKYISQDGLLDTDPLMLYYVSGIVAVKTKNSHYRRLGYFRWDICKPVEDEFSFGHRESGKLV